MKARALEVDDSQAVRREPIVVRADIAGREYISLPRRQERGDGIQVGVERQRSVDRQLLKQAGNLPDPAF